MKAIISAFSRLLAISRDFWQSWGYLAWPWVKKLNEISLRFYCILSLMFIIWDPQLPCPLNPLGIQSFNTHIHLRTTYILTITLDPKVMLISNKLKKWYQEFFRALHVQLHILFYGTQKCALCSLGTHPVPTPLSLNQPLWWWSGASPFSIHINHKDIWIWSQAKMSMV